MWMRNRDRHVYWQAIEEIWVNGQGRATVWSGDGRRAHQRTFQLGAADVPGVMGRNGDRHTTRHIPHHTTIDNLLFSSSGVSPFTLADAMFSGWGQPAEMPTPRYPDHWLWVQQEWIQNDNQFLPFLDADITLNPELDAGDTVSTPNRLESLTETIRRWGRSIYQQGRRVVNRIKAAGRAGWHELTR